MRVFAVVLALLAVCAVPHGAQGAVRLTGQGQIEGIPPPVVDESDDLPPLAEDIPPLIEGVEVRGNRLVPSDTIRYNISSRVDTFLNPDVVQRDIRTLHALGRFDSIRVLREDLDEGGIVLIFEVEEKPTIRVVDYEGMSSITESDIAEVFRDQGLGGFEQQPYNEAKIRRAESIILGLLGEQGRQSATVEVEQYEMPPNGVGIVFFIEEGPKVKVEEIDFVGNEVFSEGDLEGAMELIKETGPIVSFMSKDLYHPGKMDYDLSLVNARYREFGYVRANIQEPIVETRPKQIYRTFPLIKPAFPWGIPIPFWKKTVDRTYITVPIEENAQYRVGEINVTGNEILNDDQVRLVMNMVPGEIYNETKLRDGFEVLRDLYGREGYINFTPTPQTEIDEQGRLVNVTVQIDEDRQFFVNRINFRGNTTTRDKVIRREIMLQEGQPFSSQLWDVSLLRLNQLGYFEEITEEDAEIRPSPTDPEVDITLTVQERGKNTIGFTGGVSGIGGSFLGVDYSTNNFLGFGETLAVSLQGGSQVSNMVFSFSEPYLLDRPISAGFSIFRSEYKFDEARDYYGIRPEDANELGFTNRTSFEQARRGFNVFLSHPFKVFGRLGLTFQLENSSTSALNPATTAFFERNRQYERSQFVETGGSFNDDFRARSLIPSFTWSTLNSGYNPTAGHRFSAQIEYTGGFLGGNVNYYRPIVEYQRFKSLGSWFGDRPNVVAFRFRTTHIRGFSGTNPPFYQRFFIGGDFDIRGFEFRQVTPLAWITQEASDPFIGQPRKSDSVAHVGGDTTAVVNLEYRIPLAGDILTMAPFLDIGNSWVVNTDQLIRTFERPDGSIDSEGVDFLSGTNTGLRASTGVEWQIQMPVINAPFRLIWYYNPYRIENTLVGPETGRRFGFYEESHGFKFTVGRTF